MVTVLGLLKSKISFFGDFSPGARLNMCLRKEPFAHIKLDCAELVNKKEEEEEGGGGRGTGRKRRGRGRKAFFPQVYLLFGNCHGALVTCYDFSRWGD